MMRSPLRGVAPDTTGPLFAPGHCSDLLAHAGYGKRYEILYKPVISDRAINSMLGIV